MVRMIGSALTIALITIVTAFVILLFIPAFYTIVQGSNAACQSLIDSKSFCAIFPTDLEARDYAQLSTSVFSALIGAVAALLASFLTGWQYERQERSRTERRRLLTSQILTSEISAFAGQLHSILNVATLAPNQTASNKKTAAVQLNSARLLAIMPQQSTYEQLVAEIAVLGDETSQAVAAFYVQMRRAKVDCATPPMPIHPFAYMIQRTSEALLALERISPLSPRVIDTMKDIYTVIQSERFQTRELFNHDDRIKVFGWKYENEPGRIINRWRELAERRPLTEREEPEE